MIYTPLRSKVLFPFIFLISLNFYSQGDLMIMPKRIVFDGTDRAKEIHLINTGADSATYAISFVQYKMTETGSFEQITEPEEDQRFASDFLRYYPRIVKLGTGEAQTLRVQLSKTNSLEEGEYRSHLYFRSIKDQSALGEESITDSTDQISIKIKTVFGISIPIIIRIGEDNSKIAIRDLIITRETEVPEITMVLEREGNMSVYGHLAITYISPNGSNSQIAMIKGIAVYTPNKNRTITMQLKNLDNIDLNHGQLKIEYKEENGRLLGEARLDLF